MTKQQVGGGERSLPDMFFILEAHTIGKYFYWFIFVDIITILCRSRNQIRSFAFFTSTLLRALK